MSFGFWVDCAAQLSWFCVLFLRSAGNGEEKPQAHEWFENLRVLRTSGLGFRVYTVWGLGVYGFKGLRGLGFRA